MEEVNKVYEDLIQKYEVFLQNAKELGDEGTQRYWKMKIDQLKQKMES